MTTIYYRAAVGAVIVFDLTDIKTFNFVSHWDMDIKKRVGTLPILLLANKADLVDGKDACVQASDLDALCLKNQYIGWYHTSAKKGTGMKEAIQFLVTKVLENTDITQIAAEKTDIVRVTKRSTYDSELDDPDDRDERGNCC
eukprot:TRINITY_DN3052_c0_g1_i1.p1 TRINITY_DN3052_c0_g1~~TRINITY_DN3052_c0_g1_i1.p1  ORF type:complete len:142 (-),score=24.94 TRINITY_DN3052_c0_g1_i1:50-475(-)